MKWWLDSAMIKAEKENSLTVCGVVWGMERVRSSSSSGENFLNAMDDTK
jgi:hypothetical protein